MEKIERELREEFADLLVAEYGYWRAVTDEQIQDLAMGAMGSVSNVLAAVLTQKTAEMYRKEITNRDKRDLAI